MIGGIGIAMGLLALIIPLFGAMGSCVPFVDAACDDACTPCTDEEKEVSCHLVCRDLSERMGVRAFREFHWQTSDFVLKMYRNFRDMKVGGIPDAARKCTYCIQRHVSTQWASKYILIQN